MDDNGENEMNKDEIIELAKQAGFADGVAEMMGLLGFANFAKLVAEKEREACAKLCETLIFIEGTATAKIFAKEIRAKTDGGVR